MGPWAALGGPGGRWGALGRPCVGCQQDQGFTLEYTERWLERLEEVMVEHGMCQEHCKVVDVHGKQRHVFNTPHAGELGAI